MTDHETRVNAFREAERNRRRKQALSILPRQKLIELIDHESRPHMMDKGEIINLIIENWDYEAEEAVFNYLEGIKE